MAKARVMHPIFKKEMVLVHVNPDGRGVYEFEVKCPKCGKVFLSSGVKGYCSLKCEGIQK